jgi:hypothetical protein
MNNEGEFFAKDAVLDMQYFMENKLIDNNYFDIVIEMQVFRPNKTLECSFATFAEILSEIKNEKPVFKIKSKAQKLKVKNNWFEVHDIYGFSADLSPDCEICLENKKNTISLPCKHSFACSVCVVNIRLQSNLCPLCKTRIY